MILADLIKRAYKNNGVVTAYVYGDFGFGKTSYALWTAYEVYGDWDTVLKYVFFRPEEAIQVLGRAIRSKRRIPLLIMDDAGLWLDRLTWYEDSKIRFMELFNLIRSIAAGVIFTTPSQELPKQILNKAFFRINVTPASMEESEEAYRAAKLAESYGLKPYVSKATGYKLKTLPSFFQMLKKTFLDYYPTHYPIFHEYEKKRRRALIHYYNKLKDSIADRRFDMQQGIELARKLIHEGKTTATIVKELMKKGVPRSTAYRWVSAARNGA